MWNVSQKSKKLAVIVIKQYTYVCANGCEEMETIETGNRKLRMKI